MSPADFQAIMPLLILAGGATGLMLQIAFWRDIKVTSALSFAILVASAVSIMWAGDSAPRLVTPLLMADSMALLFTALFCFAAAATVVLSIDYLGRRGDQPEEYFLLLVFEYAGGLHTGLCNTPGVPAAGNGADVSGALCADSVSRQDQTAAGGGY